MEIIVFLSWFFMENYWSIVIAMGESTMAKQATPSLATQAPSERLVLELVQTITGMQVDVVDEGQSGIAEALTQT